MKVPGRLLDGKFFFWVTKECYCWPSKEDKLWLGHTSAQLSLSLVIMAKGKYLSFLEVRWGFLVSHLQGESGLVLTWLPLLLTLTLMRSVCVLSLIMEFRMSPSLQDYVNKYPGFWC
jgi:hypothetical protein